MDKEKDSLFWHQMEIIMQDAKYEELNQSWYKIRNERNKMQSVLWDIKTYCDMQDLKHDITALYILDELEKLNKEVEMWEEK